MGDATSHRAPDVRGSKICSGDRDPAAARRSRAEHDVEQGGPAGTEQASDADDLSGRDGEVEAVQRTDLEAADLEDRSALVAPLPGRLRRRTSDVGRPCDQADHVLLGRVSGKGAGNPAVAVDGDLVGDVADLLEAVTDERDGLTGCRALTERDEQRLGLVPGQARGRLVEEQDVLVASLVLKGPGDGDECLLGGPQCAHDVLGAGVDAVLVQQVRHPAVQLSPADPAPRASGEPAVEGEVLSDRDVVEEAQVLVHHPDAESGDSWEVISAASRRRLRISTWPASAR